MRREHFNFRRLPILGRTPLAWAKDLLARITLIHEFCHDCGRRQPLVWWAPAQLWAEVGGGGITCPKCFDRRARAKGILLMWEPRIECRREPREGER